MARPSAKEVIAGAALENIIPLQARESFGASISLDPIGGSRTLQPVRAGPSDDQRLDGKNRAEQHREGIQTAANGSGHGAEQGGPGGTHRGQAGGESEQGPGIGQGSAIGRQGGQQSANLVAGAAIGLHPQLYEPEKGCQLHLGVEQTVDGLLQPRKGRLQG